MSTSEQTTAAETDPDTETGVRRNVWISSRASVGASSADHLRVRAACALGFSTFERLVPREKAADFVDALEEPN
jgi:hypothetical protein